MDRQHCLLGRRLQRDKTHDRSAHRFADRFGVSRVVLVRLDIGLDELRGHQLHVVAQTKQPPSLVVRRGACFHAHSTRLQIGEEGQHLTAPELLLQGHITSLVYTVNLKNVLCQVQPDRRNVHFGRPFPVQWLMASPLWHFDAVPGKGATIREHQAAKPPASSGAGEASSSSGQNYPCGAWTASGGSGGSVGLDRKRGVAKC